MSRVPSRSTVASGQRRRIIRAVSSFAGLTTKRSRVAPAAMASAAAVDSIRTPRPRRCSGSLMIAASSAVGSPAPVAQAHMEWPTIRSPRVATQACPDGQSIRSTSAGRGGRPIAVWNRK
ncbi:hypothetical protein GCM10009743_31750 [Kribbella swartbergensis]